MAVLTPNLKNFDATKREMCSVMYGGVFNSMVLIPDLSNVTLTHTHHRGVTKTASPALMSALRMRIL